MLFYHCVLLLIRLRPLLFDFIFLVTEIGPEVGVEEDFEAFLCDGGGGCFEETAVVGFKFFYPFVLNADAPVDVFEIHMPWVDVTEHGNQIFLADTFIAFQPKGNGSGEEPG